ncbi:hypothetical protein MKW92_002846 [Papaver armeniacum]|nr:hypothetical protein MKW92_002846 [Papaver armeniacum]
MEECNKSRRTEEITIDQDLEKTFVLAYPIYSHYQCLGRLMTQFEKPGLKITEMRCMNVGEGFAREHFRNIGQKIEKKPLDFADPRFSGWIEYITSGHVVAMIVEGINSVKRVDELLQMEGYPFGSYYGHTVYASKTVKQAQRDIELWFRQVNFKISDSKEAVFVLPTGEIHGPKESLEEFLKRRYNYKEDFKDYFLHEEMSVLLIKPLAFEQGCVGEILDAIESSAFGLKGLTLVRSGSRSEIAVVAVDPRLTIKPGITERIISLGYDEYEVDSEYLQKIEQGEGPQGVLEAAKEFFEYGFCVWEYPRDNHRAFGCSSFRCMFEASLVGHESLK